MPETEAIPAATVVIFRHARDRSAPPELLMVIRSRAMRFAGGMAVFPGGRVDPEDHALTARLDGSLDPDEAAHRVAAIRETLEETGLAIGLVGVRDGAQAAEARAALLETGDLAPVLDRFGWTIDPDALVPYARWHPKNEKLPRVFDTRFYLHDLGTGAVDVEVDASENTRLFWSSAAGTLDAAERGEVKLIFPTRRNLERLASHVDFGAARADAEAHPVRTIVPFFRQEDGRGWIRIGEEHGYPVTGEPLDQAERG